MFGFLTYYKGPHKPNVIVADERLNGEGIVTEKQSQVSAGFGSVMKTQFSKSIFNVINSLVCLKCHNWALIEMFEYMLCPFLW